MTSTTSGLLAGAAVSLLLSLTAAHAEESRISAAAVPFLLAQAEGEPEASSEATQELDPVVVAEKAVEDARAALRQAMATGGDVNGARRNLQAAIKILNEVREQAGLEPAEETIEQPEAAEAPPSSEIPPEETTEAPPTEEAPTAAPPAEAPALALPQSPPATAPTLTVPQTAPPELPTLAAPEPLAPTLTLPAPAEAPTLTAPATPPVVTPEIASPPPTLAPPAEGTGETAAAPAAEPTGTQEENAETEEEPGFFGRLFGGGKKSGEPEPSEQVATPSPEGSAESAKAEEPSLPIFKELPPIEGPKVVAAAPDEAEVVEQEDEKRIIVKEEGRLTIKHDDNDRFRRRGEDIKIEEGTGNSTITTVTRPNGTEVITVRNASGDILQRYRKNRNGEVEILIGERDRDGRPRQRQDGQGPGPAPGVGFDLGRTLPRLQIQIPADQYIVGSQGASRARIEQALIAPPVEAIERPYSLEEIRQSERLRAKLRRIDVDTVNFEFGADTIAQDQIPQLQAMGNALSAIIADDPNEVFLIEGHTDAVGTDLANLGLSDRRAESIAVILSYYFDIPPENLVTQGYGEQYLKVLTAGPERQNRRVSVRRITPLLVGQL